MASPLGSRMSTARSSVPFAERGGRLRGLLDLATGCYPGFLFGGPVGRLLPVFHFHEMTPEHLEPRLAYLAENGYRTVTSDAIARFVYAGVHPGLRTVGLCFDDARASLWTVVGPLLRKYGLSAMTYAIPARMIDAPSPRPTMADGQSDPGRVDESDVPFVTWTELRLLHTSGLVDVQSHTYSHSLIFCGDRVLEFVTPDFNGRHVLERPLISVSGPFRYLGPSDWGAPLYLRRSRMSDAVRYLDDEDARVRCLAHVAAAGGAVFFARPGWEGELRAVVAGATGRYESPEDREQAIEEELDRSRSELNARLGTSTVRHVCLPWGIAGDLTRRALKRTGYETAFSDRLLGRRAVRAGDNPYRLMRLHDRYIVCLPGRGRKFFTSVV